MQHIILEKFDEVHDRIPLLPLRRWGESRTEIVLRPAVLVAVEASFEPLEGKKPFVLPASIIDVVADFFHLAADDIHGHNREYHIAHARQIAMYLARKHTPLSFPAIAREFDREHTTIVHATRKVERKLKESDKKLEGEIKALEKALANPDLPRSGDYVSVEKLVIITAEGLFGCSVFKPDTKAQELFLEGYEMGIDWSSRETDDTLWLQYGKVAYQRLLTLQNQQNTQ